MELEILSVINLAEVERRALDLMQVGYEQVGRTYSINGIPTEETPIQLREELGLDVDGADKAMNELGLKFSNSEVAAGDKTHLRIKQDGIFLTPLANETDKRFNTRMLSYIPHPTETSLLMGYRPGMYAVDFSIKGVRNFSLILSSDLHWAATCHKIAKMLATIDMQERTRGVARAVSSGKLKRGYPIKKKPNLLFMKKACAAVRQLRDDYNVVFKTKGHALSRMSNESMLSGSYDDLNPMWKKDRMFRALIMGMLTRSKNFVRRPHGDTVNGNGLVIEEGIIACASSADVVRRYYDDGDARNAVRQPDKLLRIQSYGVSGCLPLLKAVDLNEAVTFNILDHGACSSLDGSRSNLFRYSTAANHNGMGETVVIRSWVELRDYVMTLQSVITSRLIKPFRRRWAEGKLSLMQVLEIASMNQAQQNILMGMQKWTWKYVDYLRGGNSSALWMAIPLGKKVVDELLAPSKGNARPDFRLLNDTYSRARELVDKKLIHRIPRNLKEMKILHEKWHDNTSQLRIAYDSIKKTDQWIFDEVPEDLPDIGEITCRVIRTGAEYRQEGMDMHHCVGSYAGRAAFTVHVERGEDKATLLVDKMGSATQCYGLNNSTNPLVLDIRAKWIPVLQPMVDKAETKRTEHEKQTAIDIYNDNGNEQNPGNGERPGAGDRNRNQRESRAQRTRSRAKKSRNRKSKDSPKRGSGKGRPKEAVA